MGGFGAYWSGSDGVGRAVALMLLGMSVLTWVTLLWKAWLLRRVRHDVRLGQAAFWDADLLRALLREGESGWDMEVKGRLAQANRAQAARQPGCPRGRIVLVRPLVVGIGGEALDLGDVFLSRQAVEEHVQRAADPVRPGPLGVPGVDLVGQGAGGQLEIGAFLDEQGVGLGELSLRLLPAGLGLVAGVFQADDLAFHAAEPGGDLVEGTLGIALLGFVVLMQFLKPYARAVH